MMVAGGIVAGVFLIFVEILYKRHRGLKEKELELARNAADRWRGNIAVSIPYLVQEKRNIYAFNPLLHRYSF